jgi:multiple sugar transport system substrate-binding protein
MIELKGVAWNHTRGFVSVVATAQRYEELHPDVRISWEKRSLQAFADAPLDELARAYDVIVMDHPHTALAAREGVLLPLDRYLSDRFLADQAAHSVGDSHESYQYDGHQWTLASDAAAPIATWRPDLLEKYELELPETWDEVLALAEAGAASPSLFPVDVLMHLYMFCDAIGSPCFASRNELAPSDTVREALEELKALADRCAPECLERNPIRTAEYMSSSDDKAAAYCPFAYGYSNYSRPLYAKYPLKAGGLVQYQGRRLRSTLGGAGIAVSAQTAHPEVAADYACYTASPAVQQGLYFEAGGQPGHRTAWTDARVNAACGNFFTATLTTLDEALLRPRYPGYMFFQDHATPVAHDAVAGKIPIREAVAKMNDLYLVSLEH